MLHECAQHHHTLLKQHACAGCACWSVGGGPQVHDRMTEEVYGRPLRSFRSTARPAPVFTVPVLARGRAALEEINAELGLAFDEQARDCEPRLRRRGFIHGMGAEKGPVIESVQAL